ncbi:MAG: HTTM domain-containing protein [Deltaproteobacteria bacterium]|nr:HTTM domain-containing protein [Deltaproteobacteria bacterium]
MTTAAPNEENMPTTEDASSDAPPAPTEATPSSSEAEVERRGDDAAADEGSAPGSEPDDEPEAQAVEPRWWEDFRDFYLTFDRRTLGLTRILLAFFLLFDLLRRTSDWWKMFSNDGVLPTHFNLFRPQSSGWSFFNAFATRPELWALWALGLAIYMCLLVGYKTRVMQVLAAIYVASMNGRVLLIENGGYVVHNLLLLWTAFLPLGDRFSVDAMRESMRRQRERGAVDLNGRETATAPWRMTPHVSIVGLILVLQLAAIYAFNVIHKTGPAWHDGTAVHYVLYVDRMANPLIGAVRTLLPPGLIIVLTKFTMALEAGLPLALLSPLGRVWAKRAAIVFINALHIGFATTFVLGPFAWALCVFSTLLFSTEDWELAYRTMRRTHRARTVRYAPGDAASFVFARILRRWDNLELLTFEADASAVGLEVTRPDGTKRAGLGALFELLCALPAGPVYAWLAPLFALVMGAYARLAGLGARPPQEDGARVAYAPEPKDDDGVPTVDGEFMAEWLTRYNRERVLGGVRMWGAGAFLLVLGLFLYVYSPAMLRKFEVNVVDVVFGGPGSRWTREKIVVWAGGVLAAVGAYNLAKPFVVMNLTTPSTPHRKWLRVQASFREVFAVVMMCGAVNQALVELWVARPLNAPQPPEMRTLSHKLRYLQGWFMFSPNPVMDDGTIVTDCVTVDGRRIDPFSTDAFRVPAPLPPDMDLLHAKSYAYNQIWSDYYNRMHLAQNSAFRQPMKDYIFRLPKRTGNPNDACVKGAVYWVHDMNPRFRQKQSFAYNRDELFQFTNPDPEVHKRYQEWLDANGGKEPPEAPLPMPLPPKDKPAAK